MNANMVLMLSVFLLNQSLCNAFLEVTTRYNLVRPFQFNFTLYLKIFEFNILHCVDHDFNILDFQVGSNKTGHKNVLFSFNNQSKRSSLKDLCGCSHCNDVMINLIIISDDKSVKLKCNDGGWSLIISKIVNRNRINPDVSDSIKPFVNSSNSLYISLPISQPGCIHSFYFNDRPLYFRQVKSPSIMLKCPRTCTFGVCNKGKCRALYKDGPTCDCVTTALNGDHCNRKLRTYDTKTKNSYQIHDKDKFMFLKFTWRIFENNRYCMLEFVDRTRHVTFSIDSAHFLRGSASLTEINKDDINFVTVSKAQNSLRIKVNNEFEKRLKLIPGYMTINLGFSQQTQAQCQTFVGDYDIQFHKSGIRRRKYVKTTNKIKTTTTQPFAVRGNTIISTLIIVISTVAVLCLILLAKKCYRNAKANQKSDNQAYRVDVHCNHTNTVGDGDNESHYDSIESLCHPGTGLNLYEAEDMEINITITTVDE